MNLPSILSPSAALAARRAWRKLCRPLRRWWRADAPQFEIDQIDGPVLVAIAHPDDEAFCSGLICALRDAGHEVSLLCFTRGEGGESGDAGDGESLAQIRQRELEAAAAELGVGTVHFLDYVDPPADDSGLRAPQVDSGRLCAQLREAIAKTGARNVVTHGSSGEYWHPAHLCLHRHVRRAVRSLAGVRVWTFNAWQPDHPLDAFLNRDDPAQLTVDARRYHKRRLAALRCHESQRAVLEGFVGGDLETFVQNTADEAYHLAG